MLVKVSYRMKSRRSFTNFSETGENTRSAMNSLQRPTSEVHEGDSSASVFRKRKCVEGVGAI